MESKTQELLCMILWTCETLSRPTFRNLTESFEGWAYRKGLLRQLQRLQKEEWIERQTGHSGDRLHRLTEAGRLHALGGRDPVACWGRQWDGQWRLVLFDVPEHRSVLRDKLRRYLHGRGFGYLQNSVWITPNPICQERARLADGPVDVGSLIWMQARPCAGETDEQIVAGAWDFADINSHYAAYRKVLARRPRRGLETPAAVAAFHSWFREEWQAWKEALWRDPLLPEVLLPSDYAGRKAWQERLEAMAEAGAQMRAFQIQA